MSEKQARKHREEIEARNNPKSKMARICEAMAAECDHMTLDKVVGIVTGAAFTFIEHVRRQAQYSSGDMLIHDTLLRLYIANLSRLKEANLDSPAIISVDAMSASDETPIVNNTEEFATIGLYEVTDDSEEGSNPQISN